MDFRRILPEIRCQSCLFPGCLTFDMNEFPARFAGNSLPVLSVPECPPRIPYCQYVINCRK